LANSSAGADDPSGLADLRGKRIAFVAHLGFRPEEMQAVLKRELTKSFEGLEFFEFHQFGEIHGGPDEDAVVRKLPELLAEKQIDGAIVGIAA
jgi:hypothetical protein